MSEPTPSGPLSCRAPRSPLARPFMGPLAAAVVATVAAASPAPAQGVQYTIMPSATYVRWDEGLGLERAVMFGGRAIVDFGRLVALEGDYLVSGGVVGRFSGIGLTDSLGNPLANGTVDITSYGLRVRMHLGTARLAPFLRGGGSVVRFDGGSGSGPSQIALAYGGGLRYNASPRVRAELFAEDLRFRLDRSAIAPGAEPGTDPQRNDLRSSLAFGAGIGYTFGGGDAGAPTERWSLASIPLEAFTGRLDFSDAALGTSPLVGVRAGIDAGKYVGLRAYYLRGVASDYSALEGVQSVGGEAQFNLNALPRLAPYLVVGGGTLGFASGFRDRNGVAPADRTVLILGGGMGLRLTDKFRLNIAARDFMHGRDARLDDVSDVRDVEHDWLYSAGLSFSVGRSRRGIRLVQVEDEPPAVATDAAAAVDTAHPAGAAALAAGADSVATAADSTLRVAAARADSAVVRRGDAGYHSASTVVLPIPTEGELYIRYGPPAVRDSGASRVPGADSRAVVPGRTLAPDGASDTAGLGRAVQRMFDERRRVDSLLIRDLVAQEVGRWRAEDALGRSAAVPPAPAAALRTDANVTGDSLLAVLRAERDAAAVAQRRLQFRFDSLEAAFRRESQGRDAAADAAQQARLDAARRDAAATAAQQERVEAAQRDAAADAAQQALIDASAREAAALEQRRHDALTLVERSMPSVTAIRETERGLAIVLGNNLFASGRDALDGRARVELRGVATLLALYPDAAVVVEGHTDSTGGPAVNQRLSEARAESVRSALIAHGVSSERITARGYGDTRPVADNGTGAGRASNRRAEVIVLGVQRPRQAATR